MLLILFIIIDGCKETLLQYNGLEVRELNKQSTHCFFTKNVILIVALNILVTNWPDA